MQEAARLAHKTGGSNGYINDDTLHTAIEAAVREMNKHK
jgi:hypothetical protein